MERRGQMGVRRTCQANTPGLAKSSWRWEVERRAEGPQLLPLAPRAWKAVFTDVGEAGGWGGRVKRVLSNHVDF